MLFCQIISGIEKKLTNPALHQKRKFNLEWEIMKLTEDVERWTTTKDMLSQEKKRLEND